MGRGGGAHKTTHAHELYSENTNRVQFYNLPNYFCLEFYIKQTRLNEQYPSLNAITKYVDILKSPPPPLPFPRSQMTNLQTLIISQFSFHRGGGGGAGLACRQLLVLAGQSQGCFHDTKATFVTLSPLPLLAPPAQSSNDS